MDQQVISNVKKLNAKAVFQRRFQVTTDMELTLGDFWKHHFNIFYCFNLIDKAWRQVTYRTMNSEGNYGRIMLPADYFDGFDTKDFTVVDDIGSLGKKISMEVNNENLEVLQVGHKKNEHSTEELEKSSEAAAKRAIF